MTISSTTRQAGPYAGNDVTTVFPFAFKVFAAADLLVAETDDTGSQTVLTLTTDYSVSLNPDQNIAPGGTVTRASALPTGYALLITSDLAALQPTSLTNAGGFYPRVINDSLDRVTILVQQLLGGLSRALQLPYGETMTALPNAATRASKVLAFDADGAPTVVTPISAGAAAAFDLSNVLPADFSGKAFSILGRPHAASMAQRFGATINVKADYGAAGDNTTDDTAAIAAAINEANSAADQTPFPVGIFFPGGVYKITSALPDITRSVVLYSSSAREAVLAPIGNFDVIKFIGSQAGGRVANAGMRDMSIATVNMTGGRGIVVDFCQDTTIENVLVSDAYNGMEVRQSGDTVVRNVKFDNLRGADGFKAVGSGALRNGVLDHSDVIILDNVTWSGTYIPGVTTPLSNLVTFDGWVHTILMRNARVLSALGGFRFLNSYAPGLTQHFAPSFIYGTVEAENIYTEGYNFQACNDVAIDNIFSASSISTAGIRIGAAAVGVRFKAGSVQNAYLDGVIIEAGAKNVALYEFVAQRNGQAGVAYSGVNDQSGVLRMYGGVLSGNDPAETQKYGLTGVAGTRAFDVDARGNLTAPFSGPVYTRGCSPDINAALVSPPVGASPYVYQNTSLGPQWVSVANGTVSSVDIDDGSGAYTVAFIQTNVSVVLKPGKRLRVTYTGAPVLRVETF